MDESTEPVAPAPPEPAAAPPAPAAPPPRRPRRPGAGARLLVGIGIMGLFTVVAAVVGVLVFAQDGFEGLGGGGVADDSFLEVDLTDELSDAPGDVGFVLDPNEFPPLVTEVASAIRRSGKDERIKGLYLEMGSFGLGWAAAQEIRDAITVFSESGKPCHVYAEALDNKAYYIASACQTVHMAPAGIFLVNGFQVTTEYYAGTLEKVGVKANFEHVGDFKSAVEPFERTGPSDAASLAMNELLDSLYGQMVDGIATSRKMSPEQVRTLLDGAPITPDGAKAAGLIDALDYRDDVRETIAGEERTELDDYRRGMPSLGSKKTIAVIHAEGQIISGESGSPVFGGSMLGDRTFAEMFEEVREDEDISAIVLRVNSPGGSGLASDAMWHEIKRARAAGKPVVVSMGDYAASGGYYIAAAADKIVAEPGTLTGSIGVFGGKMNIAGLYDKVGISLFTWQRGQLAGLLSSTTDFNEVEKAKFREFLEGFYQTFLDRVAEGRGMDKAAVHAVAQGRVWTGAQAKERGLVDELGGLNVAIREAKGLADIPEDEEVEIVRLPRRKTFVDQLVEDMQKSEMPAELAASPELRETYGRLYALQLVLADGGVAAMLPSSIEIR